MTTRKALNGKSYTENLHVRFDEGEMATPKRRVIDGKVYFQQRGNTLANIIAALKSIEGIIDKM